jgi:hypothetical protein
VGYTVEDFAGIWFDIVADTVGCRVCWPGAGAYTRTHWGIWHLVDLAVGDFVGEP